MKATDSTSTSAIALAREAQIEGLALGVAL